MSDRVRLLGRTGGYTDSASRALPGEPEAVSRDDQRRITEGALSVWPHINALQQGERQDAPIHRRIERCKAQARHLGVDVHGELRLVRLALENGRSRAHVERRVEVLEDRLWPSL